jgi:hypothetical protein
MRWCEATRSAAIKHVWRRKRCTLCAMRKLSRWVTLTLTLACSHTESIRPEPKTQTPAPVTPPAPDSDFPILETLPTEFSQLGKPCDASAASCGKDGTLARVDVVAAIPVGLAILRSPDPTRFSARVEVALERDRVWVHRPCEICRIPDNKTTAVAFMRLKDEELARFQESIKLAPAPLLRTPNALRAALVSTGYSPADRRP